ncbi:hypothetical protein HBI16_010310 [Parastagonospora nodorum]|nr:hypothetical protein HBH52_079230 [Parastagonospora nodorum]KAH5787280.1 hypothetical protein HBI16_010310 [Parastagonospora nodorum]KAH6013420.1 hypothetical protein HBI84_016780 [Parastagonospora nodorum]
MIRSGAHGGPAKPNSMSLRVQLLSSHHQTSISTNEQSQPTADNMRSQTGNLPETPPSTPPAPTPSYDSEASLWSEQTTPCPPQAMSQRAFGDESLPPVSTKDQDPAYASPGPSSDKENANPPKEAATSTGSDRVMSQCAAQSTSSRSGDDPDEHNSDDSDATEKKNAPSPNGSPKRKRSQDDADESVHNDADSKSAGNFDDQPCTDKAPPRKRAATSKAKAAAKAKPAPKSAPKLAAKKRVAAKKTARPPPPPSTRPSRARKAPERFGDAIETEPVKPAKPAKSAKKAPVKKGGKVFDPVYITTNSTSRLVKADVFHMLLEPAAWTSLSTEQKIELMLMLPPTPDNTDLLEWIRATDGHGDSVDTRPYAFQISNDCFRTDVAKFRADLGNGHLGKTWHASAEQAVIDRAAGVYDTFKAEEFEEWWGQKSTSTR